MRCSGHAARANGAGCGPAADKCPGSANGGATAHGTTRRTHVGAPTNTGPADGYHTTTSADRADGHRHATATDCNSGPDAGPRGGPGATHGYDATIAHAHPADGHHAARTDTGTTHGHHAAPYAHCLATNGDQSCGAGSNAV